MPEAAKRIINCKITFRYDIKVNFINAINHVFNSYKTRLIFMWICKTSVFFFWNKLIGLAFLLHVWAFFVVALRRGDP
ncbi:hypothetical protein BpHYR1_041117 [Brachionus plicatilis]|uniref:Uncharacterized protein n=1 Tax=Brachionus plicatilis TaxID=10195 RepID=A0A3M7S487_BRAPC|nr:hypothetical protein BpHYR1_041117 [Brachionus plicatilis]